MNVDPLVQLKDLLLNKDFLSGAIPIIIIISAIFIFRSTMKKKKEKVFFASRMFLMIRDKGEVGINEIAWNQGISPEYVLDILRHQPQKESFIGYINWQTKRVHFSPKIRSNPEICPICNNKVPNPNARIGICPNCKCEMFR